MDNMIEIDLSQTARELSLPLESVQRTVSLLDEGNTVPFITRYRKVQTGALDEEQIRHIQEKVGKLRGLAERKRTILRSIESQGRLTPELADAIGGASSLKHLEDLYLPYKPKKQTLATMARQRGLEPLAHEVLAGDPAAADLQARAEALLDPEKELNSVDQVLSGAQHIIAELFSERADVRGRLRKILRKTAKLQCSRIEPAKQEAQSDAGTESPAGSVSPSGDQVSQTSKTPAESEQPEKETNAKQEIAAAPTVDGAPVASEHPAPGMVDDTQVVLEPAHGAEQVAPDNAAPSASGSPAEPAPPAEPGPPVESSAPVELEPTVDVEPIAGAESSDRPATPADSELAVIAESVPVPDQPSTPVESSPANAAEASPPAVPIPVVKKTVAEKTVAEKTVAKKAKKTPRKKQSVSASKKEKKRQRLEAAFKDYYDFNEYVSRIPPHRVLAINRGERARILRVKMDADVDAMLAESMALLISDDHPHQEFLRGCVRDALTRLLLPSLDRELRREMTEAAEKHAVEVFARNLRKLLLQPPVHHHRVLAVDPGYRSGCKLVALDEFGNVLDQEIIHVIGKEDWIRTGRAKMADLVKRHRLSLVAIGNGAACRETEQLVVSVMQTELQDQDVAFVIVNEAGASVYSTSPLGREELPTYDAVLRSAVSIGRRLLDPLSELVKINPANIGVGMYQHDVKAKHLRTSLDAVVESCVNFVGVDVNTASPALLRYVSGLNQLTARKICEYRASHGPFRSREQLKQVPGFGDASFVQAAGFLKIAHGDNPLDATWIHPESYELATRMLASAGCSVDDVQSREPAAAPRVAAKEFGALPTVEPVVRAADAVTDIEVPAPQPAAELDPAQEVDAPTEQSINENMLAGTEQPVAQPTTDDAPHVASDQGEPAVASAFESQPELVSETPAAETPVTETPVTETPVTETPVTASPSEATPGELPPAQQADPERQRQMCENVSQLELHTLATEWALSEILLGDIRDSLIRPGRDPREDLPAPVFRRGIIKLEDLEPGMRLSGTVLNVVDFGAFVDIGLPDSGLVHISRLADRFVRDPHEIVGVGDVLDVWVVEVDKQRRRVSLTAIEPGTEKPAESRQRSDKSRRTDGQRSGGQRPGGQRPGGRGGRPQEGRGRGKRSRAGESGRVHRPPPKPKPVKPITKEMEEGSEPLRSFSDLMQFYNKKQSDGNESKS